MENRLKFNEFKDVVHYPLGLTDALEIKKAMDELKESGGSNNVVLLNEDKRIYANVHMFIDPSSYTITIFKGLPFAPIKEGFSNHDNLNLTVHYFGEVDVYIENCVMTGFVVDQFYHGLLSTYYWNDVENVPTLVEQTNFAFGKKEGEQTLFSQKGFKEIITWKNDIMEGPYQGEGDGYTVTGFYTAGVKDGVWRMSKGKQLIKLKRYSAHLNALFGYCAVYSSEGVLSEKGFLIDESRHGEWFEKGEKFYYLFGVKVGKDTFEKYDFDEFNNIVNKSATYQNTDPYLTTYN